VRFVCYIPVVTYREDVMCSEYVPTDVVHQNASLHSIFVL